MSLSCTTFELVDIEEFCDLEMFFVGITRNGTI